MGAKNKKKFFSGVIVGLTVFLLLAAIAFVVSDTALAQVTIDPNFGTTLGLGTADLESTVITIVQWALGFLGLIAVIMILYGGFVWMTAAGSAEKVAKAKKIIIRAAIGLVIVLFAWAIVLFIIDRIQSSTGGGAGSGCTPGDFNGCWECDAAGSYTIFHSEFPGCGPGGFFVTWTDPSDGETNIPLCSIIQAKFNGKVLPASVAGNATLTVDGGAGDGVACAQNSDCASQVCDLGGTNQCVGDEVAGVWQTSPDQIIVEFLPAADYIENVLYRVDLLAGISEDDAVPRPFVPKTWWFTAGNDTYSIPPTVSAIDPLDGSADICLNTPIASVFSSKMRVASINTSTVILDKVAEGPKGLKTPFSYPNSKTFGTRPAVLLDAGAEYNVTLIAGTPGNNDPTDGVMDVCLNHLDGNYNTVDEGTAGGDNFMTIDGQPSGGELAPWNFFADTDTTNTECIPEITNIDPGDGKYDNAAPGVDIQGSNFSIAGNVFFNKEVIDVGNCFNIEEYPNQNCALGWIPTNVSIHTPGGPINFGNGLTPYNGAADGGVYMEVAGEVSNKYNFNVTSPQIKRVSGFNNQPHGGIGQFVSILKRDDINGGFGTFDAANSKVYFINLSNGLKVEGDFPPDPPCDSNWSDSRVIVKVPDLSGIGVARCDTSVFDWFNCPAVNEVGIQVVRGTDIPPSDSNIIKFVYTDELAGPGLCKIEPQDCGSQGSTRDLKGENFGAAQGSAHFDLTAAGVNSWGAENVNVTVPALENQDNYETTVTNSTGQTSNALPFDVPCGDIPKVVEDSSCSNYCSGDPSITGCVNDTECGVNGPCVPGMASPNPYKNTEDVCLNAIIGARFNNKMNNATLNAANIFLDECADDDPACAAPALAASVITAFPAPDNDKFTLTPASPLSPDQWYRVTVKREVTNEEGTMMNSDYAWVFKTGTANCPVEKVMCSPPSSTLTAIGSIQALVATPQGPNCTLLNPNDYIWNWSSDDPAVVSVVNPVVNQATGLAQSKGITYIRPEAEGKAGVCKIKVDPEACAFDPSRCSDPSKGGCAGSTCDIVADRCRPAMADIDGDGNYITPGSGPSGSTISVEGCWFGKNQGELVVGGNASTFDCANAWTQNLIVATTPGGLGIGNQLVDVQTAGASVFSTAADSGQVGPAYSFNVTNVCARICDPASSHAYEYCTGAAGDCGGNPAQCNAGAIVPGNGVPGLCPPGKTATIGSKITLNGYNFEPLPALPSQSRVAYPVGLSDSRDDIINRGDIWGADSIKSLVPTDAESGGVNVQVNNCPSNSLPFGISCNSNGDCSTGCCKKVPGLGSVCQPTDACSTGAPGDFCQLPANTANNGTCDAGPLIDAGGNYRCMDPSGHLDPVPPPAQIYDVVHPAVDDCRVCCDPDQDNDGNTTDDPMILGTLECTPDVAPCSSGSDDRGLYCGCELDDQCGDTATIGCGLEDGRSKHCCYPRPFIDPAGPADPIPGDTLFCTNGAIRIFYETSGLKMDKSSMELGNSILVQDQSGNDISGKIIPNSYGFSFVPDPLYDPTVVDSIRITTTTGVKNDKGVKADVDVTMSWTLSDEAAYCNIADIIVDFANPVQGVYNPPDFFNCALDSGCSDDQYAGTSGNQHDVLAQAVDKYGVPVAANYIWSKSGKDVFDFDPAALPGDPNNYVTSKPEEGVGYADITATATNFGDAYQEKAKIRVSLCEHPWPNPFMPDLDTEFPFEDSAARPKPDSVSGLNNYIANFTTWYCRDGGNLPILKAPDDVLVKEGAPVDPAADELLKEYFFLYRNASLSDDAIGIRLYENEDFKSPTDWYFKQFGQAAPQPQTLTIGGYQAVRSGRTVYVSVWNLEGANLMPRIYLMSYSEGASQDTIKMYNRMLENWEFNINMDPDDKAKLLRDLQRINDLKTIYQKALAYRDINGFFPKLGGGTYINTTSTSKWPSWQETFGAALNSDLPVDPINEFGECTFGAYTSQVGVLGNNIQNIEAYDQNHIFYTEDNKKVWRCNRDFSFCEMVTDMNYPALGMTPNSQVAVNLGKYDASSFLVAYNPVGSPEDAKIVRFSINMSPGDPPLDVWEIDATDGAYGMSNGSLVITRDKQRYLEIYNPALGVPSYDMAADVAIAREQSIYLGLAINNHPHLTVDDDDNIYVAELWGLTGGAIIKYDSGLNELIRRDIGSGNLLSSVEIFEDQVYASAEILNYYIKSWDKDLTVSTPVFGDGNPAAGPDDPDHLLLPWDVGVIENNIYVADGSRVLWLETTNNPTVEPDTCWNNQTNEYMCPFGSHVYEYFAVAEGDQAELYATLEYTGPGSWVNGPFADPCGSLSNATCNCFNYRLNVTGTSADHDPPLIVTVTADAGGGPIALPTVLSGTLLEVTTNDAGSGVARVEFYVDNVFKFADEDGTDGWTWNINSAEYPDGDHVIKIIVYDNVGNIAETEYTVPFQNFSGVADTFSPFVNITYPSDSQTVSGTINIVTHGSDNNIISQIQLDVYDNGANNVLSDNCGGVADTLDCSFAWDTTLVGNGQYYATAYAVDSSGNTSVIHRVDFTVDNGDINPPTINSIDPADGSVVVGDQEMTINITDDNGVTQVDIYIDGVFAGSAVDAGGNDWKWTWQTAGNYADGSHDFTVYAFDAKGNNAAVIYTFNIGNFIVDRIPPTVEFVPPTPANAAVVVGKVTIAVAAADDPDGTGIKEINYYLDYLRQSSGLANSWTFNSDLLTPGWHSVQVDVVDNAQWCDNDENNACNPDCGPEGTCLTAGNRSESIEIWINVGGGGGPICGDEEVEPILGEECDGANLDGEVCTSLGLGFDCGTLNCFAPTNANECRFDTSQCIKAICGNGSIECNEQCEDVSQCPSCPGGGNPVCQGCSCACQDCVPGSSRNCGPANETGICQFGTELCDFNGNWTGICQGAVYPATENLATGNTCTDSLDNDCDGDTDAADAGCAPFCIAGNERCDLGAFSTVTQVCVAGTNWVDEAFNWKGCQNVPCGAGVCEECRWDGDCGAGLDCMNGSIECELVDGPVSECIANEPVATGALNCNESGCDTGFPELYCTACDYCNDGKMNCDETGIDCGGSCAPCSTDCGNGVIDATEDCDPTAPSPIPLFTHCVSLGLSACNDGAQACTAQIPSLPNSPARTATCQNGGILKCNPVGSPNECTFDTSQCLPGNWVYDTTDAMPDASNGWVGDCLKGVHCYSSVSCSTSFQPDGISDAFCRGNLPVDKCNKDDCTVGLSPDYACFVGANGIFDCEEAWAGVYGLMCNNECNGVADNKVCPVAGAGNICCGQTCQQLVCGATKPCASGEICQNPDTCSASCVTPSCGAADGVCPAGCEQCVSGDPDCADCDQAGELCCPGPLCKVPACDVGTCPGGQVCNNPGTCNASCAVPNCGPADGVCPVGCDACDGDPDCPACSAPNICCAGNCQAPACDVGTCGSGQVCQDPGTCTSNCVGECFGQPDNTICGGGSQICCAQNCQNPVCRNDAECPGDDVCQSPGTCDSLCVECALDQDCTSPPTCYESDNAVCSGQSCTYSTPSPDGTLCVEGLNTGVCQAGTCITYDYLVELRWDPCGGAPDDLDLYLYAENQTRIGTDNRGPVASAQYISDESFCDPAKPKSEFIAINTPINNIRYDIYVGQGAFPGPYNSNPTVYIYNQSGPIAQYQVDPTCNAYRWWQVASIKFNPSFSTASVGQRLMDTPDVRTTASCADLNAMGQPGISCPAEAPMPFAGPVDYCCSDGAANGDFQCVSALGCRTFNKCNSVCGDGICSYYNEDPGNCVADCGSDWCTWACQKDYGSNLITANCQNPGECGTSTSDKECYSPEGDPECPSQDCCCIVGASTRCN